MTKLFCLLLLNFIIIGNSSIMLYRHNNPVYIQYKKDYNECINTLPRNKDCKLQKMQFEIVEKSDE